MLLLTLRGTPTLYQGDELGMVNGAIPVDRLRDPQGLRLGPERSRDPGRTPMQWNSEPFAGFSSVEPWLPVNQDYRVDNIAVGSGEPSSVLNLYRALLRLRSANSALQSGSFETFPTPDGCFAYWRRHLDSVLLVALNFTSDPIEVDLHSAQGSVVSSTYMDRRGSESESLNLRPDEGIILEVDP